MNNHLQLTREKDFAEVLTLVAEFRVRVNIVSLRAWERRKRLFQFKLETV